MGALSPCAARLFRPRPQRAPVGCLRLVFVLKELAASRDPPGGGCKPSRISGILLIETRGLFSVWEGVASLGLFAPFPSPLPPTSSGDGPALLWGFSVPLFCEPPAVCSGRLIFSLAIGPVLTLSNAARSSPFRPYLLVAGAGVWGTFLLGVAFRHVICGPYLISPPS